MLENILEQVILLLGLYLFLIFLLTLVFIIGLCLILYGSLSKKTKHKKSFIIGGIFAVLPLSILIISNSAKNISENIQNNKNLSYQLVNGSVEDVEKILKKGVSPECYAKNKTENILAKEGEPTVLYYLCSLKDIDESVEKLELLIKYGGDVNKITFNCDKTPVEHISLGYNDGCGTTPLMEACSVGNVEIVKMLLDNGADINAREFSGRTALHHAIFYDTFKSTDDIQLEIIKILLENGIDKNIEGYYHGTALDCAKEYHLENFIEVLEE